MRRSAPADQPLKRGGERLKPYLLPRFLFLGGEFLRVRLKTHPSMINLIAPVRPLRGARLQLGKGGNKVFEGASPSNCPFR